MPTNIRLSDFVLFPPLIHIKVKELFLCSSFLSSFSFVQKCCTNVLATFLCDFSYNIPFSSNNLCILTTECPIFSAYAKGLYGLRSFSGQPGSYYNDILPAISALLLWYSPGSRFSHLQIPGGNPGSHPDL